MATLFQITSSPLKENIFFLTLGTFAGSICILLFDNRLYTSSDVFLLFVIVFISFLVQAFAGSIRSLFTRRGAVLLYAQSLIINSFFLGLLYFLLPFPFDILQTARFCLLITFIETSFTFFTRYKKQYHLNLEKEKRISQSIKQQQVKELEVLKQQIDPHFIFNSFNTLAFLIDENSEKAKRFSNKLANVHRYIIFNSNKNLVSVADEVGFAQDYAYLQEIRHSNEVQINFSGFTDVDNVFILPVSIQILIENAIKHNGFTADEPLLINVCYEHGKVSVENTLNIKNYDAPSSKIGLSNLRDRCRLILGKDLEIVRKDARFKVLIPLLYK
jgi:sensor histidine kinase YesM